MADLNYLPWTLNLRDFSSKSADETLYFLIKCAVLAPSSHNSQPWSFRINGNTVEVLPDAKRSLPVSDPSGRQQYVSLGCAVENISAAAEYLGLSTEITAFGTGDSTGIKIKLGGEILPAENRMHKHRALSIPTRRTNRNPYTAKTPESKFLDWMRGQRDSMVQITIVSNDPQKSQVIELVSNAMIEAMDSDAFREELSRYVLPNITGREVGMPMYGFGMPTPPSFIAPFILKRVNVNRLRRKVEDAILRATPLFVIISTPGDTTSDWIDAGRLLERIMLEAESCGISTAPMAAAIEVDGYHEKLKRLTRFSGRAHAFLRIGYAVDQPPHSPRISADRLISRP